MQEKEIWRDVKDYEGRYQVSNLGRVKGLDRYMNHYTGGNALLKGRMLKPGCNMHGYMHVVLSNGYGKRKDKQVHQLVAIAFLNHIPCGHKLVVNHINFNRKDNRVENLEIITNRENSNQKHVKNTSKYVGVGWNKASSKWVSRIQINGKSVWLGGYDDELDASNAYQNELKKLL